MKKLRGLFLVSSLFLLVSACQDNRVVEPSVPLTPVFETKVERTTEHQLDPVVKSNIDAVVQIFADYIKLMKEKRDNPDSNMKLPDLQLYVNAALLSRGLAFPDVMAQQQEESGKAGRTSVIVPTEPGTADDPSWAAEGYTEEATSGNLSPAVQAVMDRYDQNFNSLHSMLPNYCGDAGVDAIENVCRSAYNHASTSLTGRERTETMAAFYGAEQMVIQAYYYCLYSGHYDTSSPSGRWFKGRFWTAVARVVAAVATTAVLIAIPVAGVAFVKAWAVSKTLIGVGKAVGAAVGKALVKGATLGSFTASAAIATGFSAGVKNAYENYGTSWKGLSEFKFGIKLKPGFAY